MIALDMRGIERMKFIYLLFLPIVSLILNGYYWHKTRLFTIAYDEYWIAITKNDKNYDFNNLKRKKQEIIDLLNKANIRPTISTYAEPIGFGHLVTQQFNSFDNLFLNNMTTISYNQTALLEATEVFKRRFFKSINPISWLELVIFLPQKTLEYLGVDSEYISSKVLNLLYWICGIVIAVFVEPIRDAIIMWLRSFM